MTQVWPVFLMDYKTDTKKLIAIHSTWAGANKHILDVYNVMFKDYDGVVITEKWNVIEEMP